MYILCEKKVGAKLLKVIAEFPFPDLSVHVETDVAFAGSLPFPFRSVASNHIEHPEIAMGEKYVEEDILKGIDLEMGTLRV